VGPYGHSNDRNGRHSPSQRFFSLVLFGSCGAFKHPADACALVGDQIFTDTLGANCAGVTSILVTAIHNHNIWLKLRHVAEMPFISAAKKRRIVK
jgi:predicted HAD superfamily phosphohydrolase YqeG